MGIGMGMDWLVGTSWLGSGREPRARRRLSLGTCCGCSCTAQAAGSGRLIKLTAWQ